MSYEKFKNKKEKNTNTRKKMNPRTKKTIIIVVSVIIAVLIALLITAYAMFRYYYGKMHIETVDTQTRDINELYDLFKEDLNADVSGFPQENIDTARMSVLLEEIDMLPRNVDYNPIMDALDENTDADLSAYVNELSPRNMAALRWIAYYDKLSRENDHYISLVGEVREIEPDDFDTELPPDITTPEETTSEVTTPEVTTPSDSTTPDVTTPATTTPPVTTPSVTTPGTTKPPVTTKEETTVTTETEPPAITGQPVTDDDIYNILVLGTDAENSTFSGRTDTIIVVSVNRVSKRIILSSIMRDTIVRDHEKGGYAKINSFYARTSGSVGKKVGTLINAIKYNFDIEIDNYVVLNLKAFEKVITIFGGVDVPLYYSEYLNLKAAFKGTENAVDGFEDLFTNKKTGFINVRLNPTQASRYARIRKNLWNPVSQKYQRSDDSYRTERQRNVIEGLMRQVRHMSLDQVITIANEIFPLIATDLGADAFLAKIMQYTDFSKYGTEKLNLSNLPLAWYYCKTDGYKVIFSGDPGYNELNGYTGVGILEAPYRDGYAIIKKTWKETVYK